MIKNDGYIIDNKKIQGFLRQVKVKNLSRLLKGLDVNNERQREEAVDMASCFQPEQIALFCVLLWEQKGTSSLAYINALAGEDLMFETCYMQSVLGNPPYEQAVKFGLTPTDIEDYQQRWRKLGIEPIKVQWSMEEDAE